MRVKFQRGFGVTAILIILLAAAGSEAFGQCGKPGYKPCGRRSTIAARKRVAAKKRIARHIRKAHRPAKTNTTSNAPERYTTIIGDPRSTVVGIEERSDPPKDTFVYNAPPARRGAPSRSRMQISGGVLNGKAIVLPKPRYPAAARTAGAAGAVSVQVLIDEDGNVISAAPVSGHALLKAASVEAARQAKFSPTRLGGRPVKVSGIITYNFVP